MNFMITSNAMLHLRAHKQHPVQHYRIGVMPGGCSGVKYSLTLENAPEQNDFVINAAQDVKIVIDEFSAQYLEGTTMNYVETLVESGFTFENPSTLRAHP